MEREKIIKEMEAILEQEQIKIANTVEEFTKLQKVGITRCNAEALYNANCQVIPDGAVVLMREEYEMLTNQYRALEIKYSNLCDNYRLCKDANETLKQNVITARKEIRDAVNERTIAIIKDLIGHRFAYYVKDETNGTVTCCADYVVYKDDIKFLEEKYKAKVE